MPRIIKVKWVKTFKGGRNRISIGELIEEGPRYLKLKCRTFDFGKIAYGLGGIHKIDEEIRLIPWETIELLYELPEDTDWHAELAFDDKSCVVLENQHHTLITDTRLPGDE